MKMQRHYFHPLALSLRLFLLLTVVSVWTINVEAEEASDNIPENLQIETELRNQDSKIKARLLSIFQEIDHLSEIDVEVSSGVVSISGIVLDSDTAQEAVNLTKKVDGVIYVNNNIEQDVAVASRLAPAQERATGLITSFVKKLPIIGIALAVIILFWMIGGWMGRRKKFYKKLGLNEMVANLVGRLVKMSLIALGVFIALEILDATTIASAVLGVAGVAGLALGFAFRDIVENYLAGILLSMRNPFVTGDSINIDGMSGKVIRLTSRDTVLMTFDGNHLRIPNKTIMTSSLTNFSRNSLRRFDFAVGVSVELDLIEVKELAMECLSSIKSILTDPAPKIIVEELGDSTVNMRFFAWIDQTESDFLKTKSEAIRIIKDTFDENGIEMPEPIYRVVMKNDQTPAVKTAETNTKKRVLSSSQEHQDTSADISLDKQLLKAHQDDNEVNLLDETK
ncbi:MAG: mechanosensitive ion channel domain-containing protein [Akkermansiaceae bacterium]